MEDAWSLAAYCQDQVPLETSHWSNAAAKAFLEGLNLPSVHPFCQQPLESFYVEGVAPMGPLADRWTELSALSTSQWDALQTVWLMTTPVLLAMGELWLRLFAGAIGPIGLVYLFQLILVKSPSTMGLNKSQRRPPTIIMYSLVSLLTVSACLVLMTDTYYVLNNGETFGFVCFLLSIFLSMKVAYRYHLSTAALGVFSLFLLAIYLVWDPATNTIHFGDPAEKVLIEEGLYTDSNNSMIEAVVDHWPEHYRTYSANQGATTWMPTGDARTGLPFLLNHLPKPDWKRVFLDTEDGEYVALDIAFPDSETLNDSDSSPPPVYLILHGLSGGSAEEYIRDFTHRRLQEGSTVVVMVARGLMDLPVKGWDNFHGARTMDAHSAARALQKVKLDGQVLIGVGYSMGGIVLSNYVTSYGPACALDGAISISGGLDMRFQTDFYRAQRLWQPMLTETLRDQFLLQKWGQRLKARLTPEQLLGTLRATHVTAIDETAVVGYNRFRDLNDYYTSMSALGDIPLGTDGRLSFETSGKVHTLSIPHCVVHALDDPLITWKTVVQNEGFMHPDNLVKTGSGNLMVLLTKAGGHVGWPLGLLPHTEKWRWMSDVAGSFGSAVSAATLASSSTHVDNKTVPDEPESNSSSEGTNTEF